MWSVLVGKKVRLIQGTINSPIMYCYYPLTRVRIVLDKTVQPSVVGEGCR